MAADALKYIRTMTADPAKAVTMMGRHERWGGEGGRRCQSQYGHRAMDERACEGPALEVGEGTVFI